VLQNVTNFGNTLVFECFEGVDFGWSPNVFMVVVVVFDALGTQWFDAGGG
jgi:hypothetical protein